METRNLQIASSTISAAYVIAEIDKSPAAHIELRQHENAHVGSVSDEPRVAHGDQRGHHGVDFMIKANRMPCRLGPVGWLDTPRDRRLIRGIHKVAAGIERMEKE